MLRNLVQKLRLQAIATVFKLRKGFDPFIINQLKLISADSGQCAATFTVNDDNCDEYGHLSSGFSTTLVDTMTSFGLSTILYTKSHVSVLINMHYYKPVKYGEKVIIKTRVIKLGKNLAFLEADLSDLKNNEILAKGTHIKFVMDKSIF
ncbi:acyl-coenzyme A thioesterase 13-like [Onthophagus taurus]|uniref:acyl-coenzyme A thioesterase 13-like n=1 Tax=Onthophagus taurus TaxID=166361 RepID=UPI0039BEA1D1